ncbi:MAG: phospholipid/cholesterol/gamma-HCH transport system permease protein [Actinomycetota bacterium]|jgi:phospholipid/cholesterol/gamma-HCH transport system permease protein|nr:transporter permease [Cryptosporangiaceae bacterium]MDQ1678668.1 phospholipid/cholesterol/gamma-HCH transport system permease protein [Actinomycetota bacterium]
MTEARDDKTGTLPSPPRPSDVQISLRSIAGSVRRSAQTAGEIAQFSAETLRDLPSVRLYASEIFRQAGLLIIASGLIIWLMEFVIGGQCGLEAHYTLEAIGAPIYSGIFTSWCGLREMAPYMWGYILAAKVGCGLVAEIGSMRISEEIDAMEVMGVRSRSYLVATRVLAAWISMPFLYVVGLGAMYLAEYLVVVVQLGGVSEGGYSLIFWLFQNPLDFAYSLTKVMVMGTVIVFVGCYYGFTAGGGPVGVGLATAKSMMVNMVLIHVVGVLFSQLFWGLSPNAPIAN